MNGKFPISFATASKKSIPGPAIHAGLSRRRRRGNVPCSRKPAKMVEAYQVNVRQQRADPVDAPPEPALPERFPVVDGIAPPLTLSAESVGRDAGNDGRAAPFVQQEKLPIGPNVARLARYKKRQVADQPHVPGTCIFLQAITLVEQQELPQPNAIDLTRQLVCRLRQCGRLPLDQIGRPIDERRVAVFRFQRRNRA